MNKRLIVILLIISVFTNILCFVTIDNLKQKNTIAQRIK